MAPLTYTLFVGPGRRQEIETPCLIQNTLLLYLINLTCTESVLFNDGLREDIYSKGTSICLMYQRSVSCWNRRGLKFGCCSSISPLISILSQAAADPVLPGHKLREREMVSRDSSTKVLPLLWPTILTPSLTRIYHQSSYTKGTCHLRFSGIRPLRGGGTPLFR